MALNPSPAFRRGPTPAFRSMWAFTRRYALPLWPWYAGGIVTLAATNFLTLEIPRLAKQVVNGVEKGGTAGTFERIALLIIALGLLQILIRSLSRILMFWPGRTLEAEAKTDLFGKTLRLPESFYSRFGMGDLISRMTNDMGQIRVFFAFGLLMAANLVFLSLFIIAQMALTHPTLTLVVLAPLGLMVVIMAYGMPANHRASQANQEALGELSNRVTEAFVNVHVIQANSAAEAFLERAKEKNERVYRTYLKTLFLQTVVFPLMTMLAGLSQLGVLFYGGREIIAGRLTIGDILVFNVYIAYLSFPLSAVGIILAVGQRARTAIARLREIDEAAEEGAKEGAPEARASALLEVRGLTFSFDGGTEILSDVSFSIPEGGSLGLFGPIGSGKTTLFNLITRIHEPPAGTIFYRGRDVLEWDPLALRREIGYALQTVHLFSDTVKANLAFGHDGEPTDHDLRSAARDAAILGEIEHFDQGWETPIGEKGVRLSGGQKQRLALARVFLREHAFLLLDDVLSAVDQSTERKLVAAIRRRCRSFIVASHRLSVLEACSEVIVLREGRVVERGRFEDLRGRVPELAEGGDHAKA